MRKLLLLPLLLLASCAPLLGTIQGDSGTLTRDGAAILLTNKAGGPMIAPVVRVEGPGLALGTPCVARAINVYGCVLPDVPEGSAYRLTPTAGSITKAGSDYYRTGSGARFIHIELP